MKIYFLSSQPCILTVNDAYFGLVDGFERFAELSLKDRLFLRFTPEGALPIGFFLTENIRFSPPEGVQVYLLPDGIAVYACDFPPADFTLRVLAQKTQDGVTATVFQQGALQLSLESKNGLFLAPLDMRFKRCSLDFHEGLTFIEGERALAVYTAKGECAFCESVRSYRVEKNELSVTVPLSETLGRFAESTYSLGENGVVRTAFALRARSDGDEAKTRDELLPHAFFESVLIGANYAETLSDELAVKAEELGSFLGDFKAVTLTADPSVCGLTYEKGERLYEVVYYTVQVENGKITNITK